MGAVRKKTLAKYAGSLEPFINQISDYALYLLDTAGSVLSWNAGAERLLGYTAQEVIGCHCSEFYTLEDLAADKPRYALEVASRNGTCQVEELRVRKDRTRFWATETTTALKDQNGNLQGFAKLTRDITERKANEAALRVREAKYRALFENSYDAIFLTKPEDGAILAANSAACKLFGYSEQELISLRRDQVLVMTDPRVAPGYAQRTTTGAGAAELTFIRKGGERFEARVSSKLFTDENGVQMACTIIHDITERKGAEEALRQSEERFRLLYENAPIGIVQIDQNGYLTSANRKYAEISGYSREEVIGFAPAHTTLPEERVATTERLEGLFSGKIDTVENESRLQRKDGSTIWIRTNVKMMHDDQGKPQEGIVIIEDITERKLAEEALRESEEKFRATFEHVPIGISECTIEGRFLDANPKHLDIHGYTKDEMVHLTIMDVTHPGDVEATLANLQKLAAGEIDSYVMEKRVIRKDRSMVWIKVTTSHIPIHGKPKYVISAVEDITARKKVQEDLKRAMESAYHQASHDMLTGLANRAAFNDRLKEALSYARRDGHLVALHMIDLDGFKSVNDTLGHHIGDLLLKDVAKRIKSNIRATDLAARLGGDEFVVIQTHLAEPAAAAVLAGKLGEDLGRTYLLEDQQVHGGASLGIALYPNDAKDPEELIKQADLALYDAKHRGRFNYQFYRQELGVACREAQRLEQELTRALHDNQFCLHYQPQFDLKSGGMTGIEALLRWNHPTRGPLVAADFIQNAERARLMPSIGEWTLQSACRQYKQWIDSGLAVPLTLNLSAVQLRNPRLLETLKRILDETGLPASMLQLEMRERVLWDPKFPKSLLHELKESGLRLALDDFGTEMTTLLILDRFPLDAVKPGQGLVRKLPLHKREATMLAAIIDVAHHLNIAVCADGVETDDQLAAVKGQGCDFAQGYVLSSPRDANEMKQRIDAELMHCPSAHG